MVAPGSISETEAVELGVPQPEPQGDRTLGRETVPFTPANDVAHLVCPQRDTVSGSVAGQRLTILQHGLDGQVAVRGVGVDLQPPAGCVYRRGQDPAVHRAGVQ